MSDTITVSGTVATDPRHVVAEGNVDITSFRLASPQRYWDRKRGAFVENEVNWYTVTAFRRLAAHAVASLHKGERVLVRGRVRVRTWTDGERSGRSIEIEADALGHDLLWGTSVYTRDVRPAGAEVAPAEVAVATDGGGSAGDPTSPRTAADVLADRDAFAPVF